MMADGSQLRSGGETWGPVSPDNVDETGVSPCGRSGSPIVAPEAEPVERTRRKTRSRARSRFLCLYDGTALAVTLTAEQRLGWWRPLLLAVA
jgi:hypothetical protein